jgi:hypothetical protein
MKNKNENQEKKIVIGAFLKEYPEQLARLIFRREAEFSEILNILKTNPSFVIEVMKEYTRKILKDISSGVTLKKIDQAYNSTDRMGNKYVCFEVELEGTEKALMKIVGEENYFAAYWRITDSTQRSTQYVQSV